MYLDSVPMDISLSPQELIFSKLNAISGLALDYRDFVFSDPEVVSANPNFPRANTKVSVTPKAISNYYNSFTVYYNRMDVARILNNPLVSITRGTATKLSELIDQINLEYNVNFRAADYEEAILPPVDPSDPNAIVKVPFVAKAASFLFKGSYELELNKPAATPHAMMPVASTIYIAQTRSYDPIYKSTLLARTSAGEEVNSFSYMRNATSVSHSRITSFWPVSGSTLALFGRFEFSSRMSGTEQAYSSEVMLMDTTGKILQASSTLFGGSASGRVFKADSMNGYLYALGSNGVVSRYLANGTLDTYTTQGYPHKVVSMQPTMDGKLYVQSEPITASGVKHIYLDRFNQDGTKDTTFSTVDITATHGKDPWPIATIAPIEADMDTTDTGAYILFAFDHELATLVEGTPIINGAPVVDGSITTRYGYLPIAKITDEGDVDTYFSPLRPRYQPDRVFKFSNNAPTVGDTQIAATGNSVAWMTYGPNPITGDDHWHPVRYNDSSRELRMSGDNYFHTYKVKSKPTLQATAENYLVVGADVSLADPNTGRINSQLPTVVMYSPDGSNSAVIWQAQPERDGTPQLTQFHVLDS